MLKVLDLFSGLGGFSLGLERTGCFKTTAFCDNDKYSRLLLQKHWKGVKIYNDVREINKEQLESDGIQFPDVITGGFPCQPFSVAGKQKGTSDDRHLWPEMFRIIKEFTPRWIIGENVKGLTNIEKGMVFESVCTDLEGEGYEVRAFNIPAAGVGAPHRRERIWIVAHAKRFNESESIRGLDEAQRKIQEEHRQDDSPTRESSGTGSIWNSNNKHENMENSRRSLRSWSFFGRENENEIRERYADQHQRPGSTSESDVADAKSFSSDVGEHRKHQTEGNRQSETRGKSSEDVADASAGRRAPQEGEIQTRGNGTEHQGWWSTEPNVGRVANGVSGRVYRLKALGNSIVPQIATEIGYAIIKAEGLWEM